MSEKREWYLPDASGTGTVGPFSTDEILAKIRTQEVRADEYIWGPHMGDEGWARIYELEELRGAIPSRRIAAPPIMPQAPAPAPEPAPATVSEPLASALASAPSSVQEPLAPAPQQEAAPQQYYVPTPQPAPAPVPAPVAAPAPAPAPVQAVPTASAAPQGTPHGMQSGEYGIENVFRRFPRVPLSTQVIINNQRQYHRTRSVDISEKGLLLRMDDTTAYEKGEEVIITVRNVPGIGTFSTPAVVMRILNGAEMNGYGVFFLRLNPIHRRKISEFILSQLDNPPFENKPDGRIARKQKKEAPAA